MTSKTVDDIPHDEIWEAAKQVAPYVDSFAAVGRATNDRLDVDWSDAFWRGLFKRYPREQAQVSKLLNTNARQEQRTITIDGNTRCMIISDIHAPFHDYNAIQLVALVAVA